MPWGDGIGSRDAGVEPDAETHDDGGQCVRDSTGGKRNRRVRDVQGKSR